MTVQEWLGSENQLGIDIWQRKYQQDGESFDGWLNRVSGGNEKIKQLIKDGHMTDYQIYKKWNILPVMTIYFDNHKPMPIREYKWDEYLQFNVGSKDK